MQFALHCQRCLRDIGVVLVGYEHQKQYHLFDEITLGVSRLVLLQESYACAQLGLNY